MPVAGNRQPFGLLHGGASVVLAESLGSIAAALHGGPEKVPVGIEINATHHRSATSGHVTGTATAITLGRTLATLRGRHRRRRGPQALHLADHLPAARPARSLTVRRATGVRRAVG